VVLGGLARRVNFVNQLRAKHNHLIVVDSGRLFQDPRTADDAERVRMNAQLFSRTYAHMGVYAVNVGDTELLQGISFLKGQASRGLNLISANLVERSNKKPIFPPYVIYTAGNIRIAFLGLLDPGPDPEIDKAMRKDVVVIDPIKAAQTVVPQLTEKADVVILLSDLGLDKERNLIRKIRGIHFIMGGREGRFFKQLSKEKTTYIGQSYRDGMYTGRLDLTVKNTTSPFRDEGRKFYIKEQLADLDRRLKRIKNTLKKDASNELKHTFQNLVRKRAQLLETLNDFDKLTYTGNLFRWELVPLDSFYREDREIVRWIGRAGFTEHAKR
jgi:2',3'-cyclic-nucleotide 2'-phosphodiesterase (5'-nucleotidase family)